MKKIISVRWDHVKKKTKNYLYSIGPFVIKEK